MKFYGKGLVWDPERQKMLCEFDKNGELIVEDDRTIKLLLSWGYRSDTPREVKVEIPAIEKEPEKEVKKVPTPRKPRTKKAVSK